ncbi:MAG: hypothetical protein AAF297_00165 [Planctomycetota bacterium]
MDRRTEQRSELTDARLDELVRTAALSGPTERDHRGSGLPVLTRVLITSGLVSVAGLALAVVVAGVGGGQTGSQTGPHMLPGPGAERVADAGDAPRITEETLPKGDLDRGDARGETARPSFVIARFSAEDSAGLEGLWFAPEGSDTTVPVRSESAADESFASVPASEQTASAAPAATTTPAATASRRAEMLALGRLLRSADIARDTLAIMSPAEQLEACLLWTSEISLRPVAFERLAHLSMDPAVAGDVRRASLELMNDPAMRPWLASHGLAFTRPAAPPLGRSSGLDDKQGAS